MWSPKHRYKTEITEEDPRAEQPEKLTVAMKPHQLASLHKAMVMEREGCIYYSIDTPDLDVQRWRRNHRGNYTIRSNMGMIGDMVGYGKTLTALGIIASTPVNEIHVEHNRTEIFNGTRSTAHVRIEYENATNNDKRKLFECTLVVVPFGPVYKQWANALEENKGLRYLAIDDLRAMKKKCPAVRSNNDQLHSFFKNYDVVLIKNTGLSTMIDYYTEPLQPSPIRGFVRIMLDEAHDIIKKTPTLDFNFLWFISATYQMIGVGYGNAPSSMLMHIKELLPSPCYSKDVLVKCENDFTKKSFEVPPYNEFVYECLSSRMVNIVQPFLNQNVVNMVNANDIEGAIRELGGNTETKENLIDIVTRNIKRDIHNKEREKEYVQGLEIDTEAKTARVKFIDAELKRLEDRKTDLEERIRTMNENGCSICYDEMEAPVMLPCTHAFCGGCIMKWVEMNETHNLMTRPVCPTCRTPITKKEDFTAIVKDKNKENNKEKKKTFTKVKTAIKIISKKKDGRFIIFSQHDMSFYEIYEELKKREIPYSELKGQTNLMNNILERFKNGNIKVILLNTRHAGSGIDISFATDVILFHSMDKAISEQAIGRAQRVGRTDQLTVHHLLYPHEMN